MTEPTAAQPQDPSVPPAPPAPPAYDSAPYVAPTAPVYDPAQQYDTTPYPAPAAAAYEAPSYPAPPYAAYPPQYPVQTSPGAPPVAGYGYGYGAPARRTNGLAVAAMVLSILGFVWILPFVGSLAGAIMGHISLGQIARTGDGGRGMALAGVIVGWVGLGLLVVGVLFIVFVVFASTAGSSVYGA